jgi:hypothetical protein
MASVLRKFSQQTCNPSRAKKVHKSLSFIGEMLQHIRFTQNKQFDRKLKVIQGLLTDKCRFVTRELKEKKKLWFSHARA